MWKVPPFAQWRAILPAGVIHMASNHWAVHLERMIARLQRHGGDDGLFQPLAVARIRPQDME